MAQPLHTAQVPNENSAGAPAPRPHNLFSATIRQAQAVRPEAPYTTKQSSSNINETRSRYGRAAGHLTHGAGIAEGLEGAGRQAGGEPGAHGSTGECVRGSRKSDASEGRRQKEAIVWAIRAERSNQIRGTLNEVIKLGTCRLIDKGTGTLAYPIQPAQKGPGHAAAGVLLLLPLIWRPAAWQPPSQALKVHR